MTCFSFRSGGTLLEVLLSLLIVGMILHLVLEASGQMRGSERLASDNQHGSEAAMRWRAARAAGESWAQGEAGAFPEGQTAWRLVVVRPDPAQSAPPAGEPSGGPDEPSGGPDERWRALELKKDKDADVFHRMVLRLRPRPMPAATQPAGDNRGTGKARP